MSVAIVIPTYNRGDLLANCLASIGEHTPERHTTFVMDNGSTDDIKTICKNHKHVTYTRLDTNTGFGEASNRGAWLAVGHDVVVFLNNDTIVHPGWLAPLTKVLDTQEDVAIVGSRLLYPDGTLQHAGVNFTLEDNGVLMGHNILTEQPAGEVIAVTGACMAVERSVFMDYGGFDNGYLNGNEDCDLCLTARADGWKIWYEPTSTITHLESQSGAERWTHVGPNIVRLTQKWANKPEVWQ